MSKKLKLVTSSESSRLPTMQSIKKAIEVANMPEVAEYLHEQLKEIAAQLKLTDQIPTLLSDLKKYADRVAKAVGHKGDIWGGEFQAVSKFQNYQRALATQAAENIGTDHITMHYAIDEENAHFIRGYQGIDGNPPPESTVNSMDTLFNAWLADNDMISRDGIIYEADEQGHIKKDETQGEVKAKADKIKQIIEKLPAYVKNNNQSVEMEMKKHPFKAEQRDTAKTEATTQATGHGDSGA